MSMFITPYGGSDRVDYANASNTAISAGYAARSGEADSVDNLQDFFIVEKITATYRIASFEDVVEVSVAKSGYKALAIVGWDLPRTHHYMGPECYIDSNEVANFRIDSFQGQIANNLDNYFSGYVWTTTGPSRTMQTAATYENSSSDLSFDFYVLYVKII